MRILHLDSGRSLRGGQKQVLLLLKGLQERGHTVILGCREGALCEEAKARGIPVWPIPLWGEWDLYSAWKIARYARTQSLDFIHTHDAHTHTLVRLAQLLGLNIPLVVHRRVDFPISPKRFNRWKYLQGVKDYIVVAKGIGTRLETIGVLSDRIHWIPSSVDLQALATDTNSSLPEGVPEIDKKTILITCIGALEKQKGQHLLISCIPELIQQYPSLLFYFLGEGPDHSKLRSLAQSLGVQSHCRFPGYVQPIAPIIKRSLCMVLPTLSEGFSPAALESMALGIPVIASATGGLLEMIDSGENGILFTPGDRENLSLAIRRMLEDPGLAPALGMRAKEKVHKNFTVQNMVNKVDALYQKILKE